MPSSRSFLQRSRMWLACGAALLLIPLAGAPPLTAEDVQPGIDLWKTAPDGQTTAKVTIPADFFEAGSDGYPEGMITLQSAALKTAPGTPPLAPSDTVIERLETAHLSSCGGPSATIHAIIRGVHMKSVGPFSVTYGGLFPEEWDVEVCLSDSPQREGTMTIHQECFQGGTFTSELPVRPKFIFTRRRDLRRVVLDPGIAGEVPFQGKGGWVHETNLTAFHVPPGAMVDGNCDDEFEAPLPGTSNFTVGIFPNPCDCFQDGTHSFLPFDEKAALNNHRVAQKGYFVGRPSDDRQSFPLQQKGGQKTAGFFRGHSRQGIAVIALLLAAMILPLRRPR